MDRKLVLAMAAILALGAGCGDDEGDGGGGTGGNAGSYFGAACTPTGMECTGNAGAYTACCTAAGTCGVNVDGTNCDMGCGQKPCVAAPTGSGCCDGTGMCGAVQADGSCVAPQNEMCGTTMCESYRGHAGCCMADGVTCGLAYRGGCGEANMVEGLVDGTGGGNGGTSGGGTGTTGDGGTASIMCGTTTCVGQMLSGIMAQPCCKDAATNTCGYNASLLDASLACATQAEVIAFVVGNGGGDGGTTGGDGGATGDGGTTGDSGATTGDGGVTGCAQMEMALAMQGFDVATCCLPAGTCGIDGSIFGCINPGDFDANLAQLTGMFTCNP